MFRGENAKMNERPSYIARREGATPALPERIRREEKGSATEYVVVDERGKTTGSLTRLRGRGTVIRRPVTAGPES